MTPQMRSWLENVQDIDFSRYGYRIVGLGIAGAGGSVYLTCGLIAVAYWMISTKRVSGVTVLCFVIQFVAIAFVGRTGFYAAIVILFITFICLGNSCGVASLKLFGYLFLLMAIFIVLYNIVLAMYEIDTDILKYTYNRLWEIFEDSDSSTVQTLQRWNSMLPSINLRMFLLGTGVTRGTSFDGLRISHDGGYAKRYASIGLMMAIYSYLSYYRYVFKYIKLKFDKSSRFFMYFVVVIMIVIEYKEPFMYQLALPFTVLMISSLGEVSKVE
jgi:hypothetical protein